MPVGNQESSREGEGLSTSIFVTLGRGGTQEEDDMLSAVPAKSSPEENVFPRAAKAGWASADFIQPVPYWGGHRGSQSW